MSLLYQLGIFLYGSVIRFAALFNPKARQWLSGRKSLFKDLQGANIENCLWMHCASLGEFEQGRPILEELRIRYPNYPILLTFFSPSGYEVRKNYAGADYVTYLPLDTKRNAIRFLQTVKPKMAVFVKYEVWHQFYREIGRREIPLFLISCIFRKDQIYFKKYGYWFRNTIGKISRIYTQDEKSLNLLKEIGVSSDFSGDTRFDRVLTILKSNEEMPDVKAFTEGFTTIVAGSTWPKDESVLLEFARKNKNIRLIIAPHEIGEDHIQGILSSGKDAVKWSEWDGFSSAQILVIDAIGKLSVIYRYADVAYIGGGFGKGIHNTLEAAVYGVPVIFGPNYQKFKEARDLIREGGGFSVHREKDLLDTLQSFVDNSEKRREAGKMAEEYVLKNAGATAKIVAGISTYLD